MEGVKKVGKVILSFTPLGLTGCSAKKDNDTAVDNNIVIPSGNSPKALKYLPDNWNNDTYLKYTNCYAYAFNMRENPLTGERFPIGGMQPGMLSGQYPIPTNWDGKTNYNKIMADYDNYSASILSGTAESNENLVNMVTADAKAAGLEFLPYSSDLTGGYAVALVVDPLNDYHWYRENGDSTWSHKPGRTKVTDKVTSISNSRELNYGDVITNPQQAGKEAGYSTFVGYYYIRPLGE